MPTGSNYWNKIIFQKEYIVYFFAAVLALDFFLVAPALATRRLLCTAANLANAADFKSAL